jgi:flagellar protein FlgJ
MSNSMNMNGELSTAGLYTDFSGLSRLRSEASQKSADANREVAQQFEALFLQLMLKSMRDASQMTESTDGEQTRFYQEMFDKQIALDLSRTNSIGLADTLEAQFNGTGKASISRPVEGNSNFTSALNRASSFRSSMPDPMLAAHAVAGSSTWTPESPEDFTRELWPHAVEAAEQLGVAPEVLVAQSALETGWGQKIIQHQSGQSSCNLFGIKADHRWQGERVSVDTLEFRDGIAQRERADFRAYDSPAHAMQDYVDFIQSNPRYARALDNAADAGSYLQELQRAGYSTDPEYASKIQAIISRETFGNTISEMQLSNAESRA